MIDANGKVVTQATGIGGDHYQPFNLKGRKALEGGRPHPAAGRLTTDDLRTLLTSNARAGMVVSASGVFDIEFDPSFRNQKRLSERALGMVDTTSGSWTSWRRRTSTPVTWTRRRRRSCTRRRRRR